MIITKLFLETLTSLNEDSLSDILCHKVNVCLNYVHFVSFILPYAVLVLVLVSNTSVLALVLVLPTLVLVLGLATAGIDYNTIWSQPYQVLSCDIIMEQ